jgi:phosphate uptake regulator
MARDLSRLVYHCSQIANHILSLEHKRKVSQGIMNLVEDVSKLAYNMQKDAVQSFLRKDLKIAVHVLRKMDDIREKEKKLLKEVITKVKDVDTAVTMGLIGRDLRRIAGYSVAIADDGMNRVLSPVTTLGNMENRDD